MSGRQSLHDSQSMVISRKFLGLWLLKHWKIRIAYRQWRSNFPVRGRKPKYDQKNRKLRIQLWQWYFSRLRTKINNWKISSDGEGKVNNWEFCILKVTPIVVFVVIQTLFSSWFVTLLENNTEKRKSWRKQLDDDDQVKITALVSCKKIGLEINSVLVSVLLLCGISHT